MADEPENVVEEQVSETEQVSEEGEKPPEKPQPFSEEQETRIAELLATATESGKELGRREVQSKKDREVADARRRATFYEGALSKVKGYENLDPEVKQVLENQELLAKVEYYESRDKESQHTQALTEQMRVFHGELTDHLTELGIDPNDSRIDWAEDENDFNKALPRFNKSTRLILKDLAKKEGDKQSQLAKDKEAQRRKDEGLDEVDTSSSAGASTSDTEFLKKFSEGTIPMTKGNVERANKLIKGG